MPRIRAPFVRFVPLLFTLGAAAGAQCATTLVPGGPVATLSGTVRTTAGFDPDGAGPEPAWLLAGGDELSAGDELDRALIGFDGTRWRSVGLPVTPGRVRAMAVWNGELVAGGEFTFTTSAGPIANNLARWDGTTWRHLGTGTNGPVHALAVFNGELVAAGSFPVAGGAAGTRGVARWNGTTWAGFGGGWSGFGSVVDPGVRALAVFQGSLFVGGSFQAQGPVPQPRHLACWNGTAWTTAGDPDQPVNALAVRTSSFGIANTWLFATGAFATIGGSVAARVAARNGATATWSPLGGGLPHDGLALHVRSTGTFTFEVFAAHEFGALLWNGTSWNPAVSSASPSGVLCVGSYSGQYVLGSGPFPSALHTLPVGGTTATPVRGLGLDGAVNEVVLAGDEVLVGGKFQFADGQVCNRVARRTGTGPWAPLGIGMLGPSAEVNALAVLASGDVLAGGRFTSAGGVIANHIARWNGSAWSAVGGGFDEAVFDLLALPNGDVVAAGAFSQAGGTPTFRVARLAGGTWHAMGGGMNGVVWSLARLPNGDVIAGGLFTEAHGPMGAVVCNHVARWNGTAWTPLGNGIPNTVDAVAVAPDGTLFAGGNFGLARWDGVAWLTVPNGTNPGPPISMLAVLPDGDLLASTPTTYLGGLARVDGTTWTAVGSGFVSSVNAVGVAASGHAVIGGAFRRMNGAAAGGLAILATNCPALVGVHGAGCTGASGPMTMTSTTAPWTGTTFRAVSSPFAPLSLALSVFGFQPSNTPLQAVLPQAFPGCMLLASPDAIAALVPTGFTVTTQLAIPPTPSLGGAQVFHQVVALGFDAAGALTGVASTNALALTIGTL